MAPLCRACVRSTNKPDFVEGALMRSLLPLAALALLAACSQSQTPQEKQIESIRADADKRADAIEDAADRKAGPLDEQAKALRDQAKQAGGFDSRRLEIEAESLEKQADLIRDQAEEQAEAVMASANAKVQAIESR
jgi:hypothetical protein